MELKWILADAITNLEQTGVSFINSIRPIVWIIVAIALVGTGIACIVGGDEGRQRAKKTLPWVAIGAVLIVGAMEIAKYVIGQIAF